MLSVVIRADGNESIGYGHLVRSCALAAALRRRHGLDATLWTRTPVEFDLEVTQRVIPREITLEAEADWIATENEPPQVVILDLWRPTTQQLGAYGPGRAWRLVCIDDESENRGACDISVDPGLLEREPPPNARRHLGGRDYVLLRRAFEGLKAPVVSSGPARVLVCFGGADAFGLSERVVEAWTTEWPASASRVTLVMGPGADRQPPYRNPPGGDSRWHLVRSVVDMATVMQESDVGLFTASTLLYEALAAGLPSLCVSVSDVQRGEAWAAARLGAAVDLGPAEDLAMPDLTGAMCALVRGDRAAMSRRAQGLIDGRGCERVANEIVRMAAAKR